MRTNPTLVDRFAPRLGALIEGVKPLLADLVRWLGV
jgi:hypothetical protein